MRTIKRLPWMPKEAKYVTKDNRMTVRAVWFWMTPPGLVDGIWTYDGSNPIGSIFWDQFPAGGIAKIKTPIIEKLRSFFKLSDGFR